MTVFSRAVSSRLIAIFATLTVASLMTVGSATAQTASRDPWTRPFSADSIWNTSLGSSATYVNANLQDAAIGGAQEVDWLIRVNPGDPWRQTFFPGDTQRYRAGGTTESWIGWTQIPDYLIIPDVQGEPGQFGYEAPNACSAFLQPDGYSLIQWQPTTRLASDGPLWGYPQRDFGEANGGNLFGPGHRGTHYGSGLSAIGGTIRIGEFTASNRDSIRHAVKLLLGMAKYGSYVTTGDGNPGWRWPAIQADNYADPSDGFGYGLDFGGQYSSPNIEMGTLLAIDKTANIDSLGLTSEKAKKIAWALQNYGGYIVDDAGQDQYLIAAEEAARGEFDISAADINTLFRNLKVITNNTPTSVGGGGTRRVATAPRFAYGGEPVGVYTPIANRIEAENYDVGGPGNGYSDNDTGNNGGAYRTDGVDLAFSGVENSFLTGWTEPGEWTKYAINVPSGATYTATFRYAGFGGSAHLENAGGTNLGSITFDSTNGWDTWASKAISVTLPAGNQVLRLVTDSSGYNLNYIAFTSAGGLVNRATGGTASASSNPIAAETAPNAFDGNVNTKWLGTYATGTIRAWLRYQFGGGVSYVVKQYTVTSGNDGQQRDPRNWNFQGSNDGSAWTTLNSQSNQTFPNRFQTKSYSITNTVAYRYYRLAVTATNGSTDYVQIADMQLLSQ
ncbi:MAG: carbohydrate-binding protein [Fibrella sp.]|nr:carbohydrate-binding protein [Armatimonadota bacterium]